MERAGRGAREEKGEGRRHADRIGERRKMGDGRGERGDGRGANGEG